jgi:starch synthase
MHIVHIASEFAPIAKVGGLGDVVSGLSIELAKQGHHVEVLLPKYGCIEKKHLLDATIDTDNFKSCFQQNWHNNTIWKKEFHGISVRLIEDHCKEKFFLRKNIYAYKDDNDRFLYFCKTALEYLDRQNIPIDIIHIHDWHTSIVPILLKEHFPSLLHKIKGIILTIHNVAYQGYCNKYNLANVDIDPNKFPGLLAYKTLFSNNVYNLLKAGIVYSDIVTTVSPSYAKEILTKELGFKMDKTLKACHHKLYGILNGIDPTVWNPATNNSLATNYTTANSSIDDIIKAKRENKRALQQLLNMPIKELPLVSNIGRLVEQKGPKLIKQAVKTTIKNNGQFILLGSAQTPTIQKGFDKLKCNLRKNKNAYFYFGYDERLAHLIYAASDFIVIPSIFEPCGLTQMIALCYGTIPIVRKTGGLADTVFDVDDINTSYNLKNGYTFLKPSKKEINACIKRAMHDWVYDKEKIKGLINNGIKMDFSWKEASLEYLKIYRKLFESVERALFM